MTSMISLELVASGFLIAAPLTAIGYNGLRSAGYLEAESAAEVESAWQRAIQDEKVDSSSDEFEILYPMFLDYLDKHPEQNPDHLLIASGGYGVSSSVFCVSADEQSDDHEKEALVPLVLADKWVRDRWSKHQQKRDKRAYLLAVIFLLVGFVLDTMATYNLFL